MHALLLSAGAYRYNRRNRAGFQSRSHHGLRCLLSACWSKEVQTRLGYSDEVIVFERNDVQLMDCTFTQLHVGEQLETKLTVGGLCVITDDPLNN